MPRTWRCSAREADRAAGPPPATNTRMSSITRTIRPAAAAAQPRRGCVSRPLKREWAESSKRRHRALKSTGNTTAGGILLCGRGVGEWVTHNEPPVCKVARGIQCVGALKDGIGLEPPRSESCGLRLCLRLGGVRGKLSNDPADLAARRRSRYGARRYRRCGGRAPRSMIITRRPACDDNGLLQRRRVRCGPDNVDVIPTAVERRAAGKDALADRRSLPLDQDSALPGWIVPLSVTRSASIVLPLCGAVTLSLRPPATRESLVPVSLVPGPSSCEACRCFRAVLPARPRRR